MIRRPPRPPLFPYTTLSRSPIEAVLQKGLSKLPENRYPTCTALVDALESACAATPGWRGLGRGESLNFPTMAETQSSPPPNVERSEEHTSELQSPCNLGCRL